MFVLFLISRYFVGDVWGKGGYNWYRDSWGWWMILAILTSHTFSSWPPQLGSQAAQMTELCIFCPKSLSSAVISPRSDLTQSGQIETTPSSGQRVLMTSNYWSQELESESWPLQSKQEHRHRVKQSQLSSMPAVLWLFLPCSTCSTSFDWSWDVQWAQSAVCSTSDPGPGQPDVRAGWGRALSLGSPADLSELRSWQSFVTHRESRGMARRIQPSGSGVLLSHFSPLPLVQCRQASQSEEDEGGGRFSPTWKFAQTGQNLVWCWPPQSSAETSQAFCLGLPPVALAELVGNSRKLNEGNLHKTYRLSHYTRNCPRHSLHRHTICNIR